MKMDLMSTSASASLAMKGSGARRKRMSVRVIPANMVESVGLISTLTPASVPRDTLERIVKPTLMTANISLAGMVALASTMSMTSDVSAMHPILEKPVRLRWTHACQTCALMAQLAHHHQTIGTIDALVPWDGLEDTVTKISMNVPISLADMDLLASIQRDPTLASAELDLKAEIASSTLMTVLKILALMVAPVLMASTVTSVSVLTALVDTSVRMTSMSVRPTLALTELHATTMSTHTLASAALDFLV